MKKKGMLTKILMPQGTTEKFWYLMDFVSIGAAAMTRVTSIKEYLEVSILIVTLITITMTIVIKVYNIIGEHKKLNNDEESDEHKAQ